MKLSTFIEGDNICIFLKFIWRKNFWFRYSNSSFLVMSWPKKSICVLICGTFCNTTSPRSVNYIIVWPACEWCSFPLLSFVVMPGRGKKIIQQGCLNNCGRRGNHWLKRVGRAQWWCWGESYHDECKITMPKILNCQSHTRSCLPWEV